MFAMGARGVRRERRRHSGAPMLRKYATTSLSIPLMAMARLRGVSPSLQRSELVLRRRRRAQLRGRPHVLLAATSALLCTSNLHAAI